MYIIGWIPLCSLGGRGIWRSDVPKLTLLTTIVSSSSSSASSPNDSRLKFLQQQEGTVPDTFTSTHTQPQPYSQTDQAKAGPARVVMPPLHLLGCLGLALGFLLCPSLQLHLVHSGNNVIKRVQQNLKVKHCQLLVTSSVYFQLGQQR